YMRAYYRGTHHGRGGRRIPVARIQRAQLALRALAPVEALLALSYPARVIGACLMIHADCTAPDLYARLPTRAALISDPPYGLGFARSRPRRRTQQQGLKGRVEAQRDDVVGDARPFDPRPWLAFQQWILWGANHYSDQLPPSPGVILWDKLVSATPNDFSAYEL